MMIKTKKYDQNLASFAHQIQKEEFVGLFFPRRILGSSSSTHPHAVLVLLYTPNPEYDLIEYGHFVVK